MEQLVPAYNPQLQRVLKTYQTSAMRSLNGPSNFSQTWKGPGGPTTATTIVASAMEKAPPEKGEYTSSGMGDHPLSQPPPYPVQQVPVFLSMDCSRGEKSDTLLEGEHIACFIVGGEKRLCLPQILNTVLRDFSLPQINEACDALHIFCSRCNHEQLEHLKLYGVLPYTAPSCGLITKTDAERLCNALLHCKPEKSRDPPGPNCLKVYHECFGKCKGYFKHELYTDPNAKCVECTDCHGLFSPQKFVCHSHKVQENRIVHWGFESSRWRSYLLLAKDQDIKNNQEKLQDALDEMKERFDPTSKYKRKSPPPNGKNGVKRCRYDDDILPGSWEDQRSMSAFRPWSPNLLNALKERKTLVPTHTMPTRMLPPFLHTGPPVLLNPERVIPHSDVSRYERHFAPNVELAPASQQKQHNDIKKESDNYEISTDSESLKSEDSMPSTPRETGSSISSGTNSSSSSTSYLRPEYVSPDIEAEVNLIRRAFNNRDGKEQTEKMIDDFRRMRMKSDQKMEMVMQERKTLQKEVEYFRLSHKEMQQEVYTLRQEMDRIRGDYEHKLRETAEEKHQLKQDLLEARRENRSPDMAKVKSKYKAQISHMEGVLSQQDIAMREAKREVQMLRSELSALGKEPPKIKVESNGDASSMESLKTEHSAQEEGQGHA